MQIGPFFHFCQAFGGPWVTGQAKKSHWVPVGNKLGIIGKTTFRTVRSLQHPPLKTDVTGESCLIIQGRGTSLDTLSGANLLHCGFN